MDAISTTPPSVPAVIDEIASLASTLEDSPVYYRNKRTAEGIVAMQQAARAFAAADSDERRLDAALWLGEAYLLFSSGLPDQGSDERRTGWETANIMRKLLGGPAAWETRVRGTYG